MHFESHQSPNSLCTSSLFYANRDYEAKEYGGMFNEGPDGLIQAGVSGPLKTEAASVPPTATGQSGESRKLSSWNARSIILALCKYLNILGVAVLVILTFLTVADVIGRYIFRSPILGTTELTEYMLVVIGFLCVGWCAIQGKMVVVDLALTHLPKKVQAVLNCFTLTVTLGVLVVTVWQSLLESIAVRDSLSASSILRVPAYPFNLILTAGFGVLCLVIIVQIAQNFTKVVHHEP